MFYKRLLSVHSIVFFSCCIVFVIVIVYSQYQNWFSYLLYVFYCFLGCSGRRCNVPLLLLTLYPKYTPNILLFTSTKWDVGLWYNIAPTCVCESPINCTHLCLYCGWSIWSDRCIRCCPMSWLWDMFVCCTGTAVVE